MRDLAPIALFVPAFEPKWPDAVAGDSSAAIGVALEHVWSRKVADTRRDLILSALWGCASAGCPASTLLLAAMRERVNEARSA